MNTNKIQKLLTITVPCYNSQDYMKRCLDSLVHGGDKVEIIIVDDGSTDATGEIAEQYATNYSSIVRVIHKENGGHGSGVNAGLEAATGKYFKVVDSDDWLDSDAYERLLTEVGNFAECRERAPYITIPDLFICNYIYDHLDQGVKQTMRYENVFPKGHMCNWNQIKSFRPSQYLVMHALVFRTDILRKAEIRLPEHTFYVDNIFAYEPLPYVENIYYMDIDLYHYYLGRDDQSVNEKVLMKRIDQQIFVTKWVSRCVDLDAVAARYPKLAKYMCRNISIMMAISSIHLLLIHTGEAYEKRTQLWEEIKKENIGLYYQLKYHTISGLTYLPGRLGSEITIGGYRLANRIYKFQ